MTTPSSDHQHRTSDTDALLKQRQDSLFRFVSSKKHLFVWLLLIVILLTGYWIRTQNLQRYVDATTGDYMPGDPDAMVVLRYAQEILQTGTLADVDTLRYHPYGYPQVGEFTFLSHFIVVLYKVMHTFDSTVTLGYADILYPPIMFVVALLFFFLFVRSLFGSNVLALFSTAFLAVNKAFIFRTVAGVSDKEGLAVAFFFMAFYFFVLSWKQTSWKKAMFFGILAGLVTMCTGLVWGGANFIFMTFGVFSFIAFLLGNMSPVDRVSFASWFVSASLLLVFFSGRYSLYSFFTANSNLPATVTLFALVAHFLLVRHAPKIYQKGILARLPRQFVALLVTVLFGFFVLLFLYGPSFFPDTVVGTYIQLTRSIGGIDRWGNTVAESRQPYLIDWFSEMGRYFVYIFLLASVFLFWKLVEPTRKHRIPLTSAYILFLFFLVFTRYSSGSFFNGENFASLFLYVAGILAFFTYLFVLYLRSSPRDGSQHTFTVNSAALFVLVHFFIMAVAGRAALRLVFIFTPVAALLAGYFFYTVWNFFDLQKILAFFKTPSAVFILRVILVIFVLLYLQRHAEASLFVSTNLGTVYPAQWQNALSWVRQNTPEDAVFAHWWDYGYLVQTGGRRATLSDGGNSRGAINFYTSRYLLTTPNETDALSFLQANDADYVLFVSDEVGKYPAFSSIGADLEYDRFSWINSFVLDPKQTFETRNETTYVYVGGTTLDEDLLYGDQLYPRQQAGIGAFLLPISITGNTTSLPDIRRPSAVLVYQGQQVKIPLNCLSLMSQELTFGTDGLDACLVIIPSVQGNTQSNIGAALYLSRRTKDSFFAQRYILRKPSPYFESVYDDSSSYAPLGLYNGRLFGPLQIWKANIPDSIPDNPQLRNTTLPDPRLSLIREEYS